MKIETALCYSYSLSAQEPMAYVRLIAPFHQAGINIINGYENDPADSALAHIVDIVIFQREFPTRYEDYRRIFELAKENNKPVVFELDDLLFFLPDFHVDMQSQYYAPSLLPMYQALMEADLITVPSSKLRDVLANFNRNIAVLPNYFDDNLWELRAPVRKDSSNEILTIGYMGTKSHKPDLDYISPVLLDLISRFNEKIRFQFWGIQPPIELVSYPQVKWSPQYFASYKDFAAFFQNQSADIFIAPLVDNLFNRCKSPIKFFEYSALGAPGVFSCLEPYQEVITHGENGLLASSLAEWKDYLIQLIENHELRFQLATHAQESIRKKLLLSQNSFRWKEAFQSTYRIKERDEQNAETLKIVSSINLQLDKWLQTISDQIAEKDDNIQSLSNQLELVLSGTSAELKVVKQALDEANNRANETSAELKAVRQALDKANNQANETSAELKVVRQALDKANNQASETTAELKVMKQTLDEANHQASEIGEELEAVKLELSDTHQKSYEMGKEMDLLRDEILGYVLSKSWQLTRPFRKLKKILNRLAGGINAHKMD